MLRTRIFDIAAERGLRVEDLARRMGMSSPAVYRVRAGTRGIGEGFIVGAQRAFPDLTLADLFYVEPDQLQSA